MRLRLLTLLTLVSAGASLTGCGGGGGDSFEAVAFLPKPASLQTALSGPWPTDRLYFVIQDSQSWAVLWAERRAFLRCTDNPNQDACNIVAAPDVDFSVSTLIGVNLGTQGRFSSPDQPLKAYTNGTQVVVEYGFVGSSGSLADVSSAFELLPRTSLPITFQAKP